MAPLLPTTETENTPDTGTEQTQDLELGGIWEREFAVLQLSHGSHASREELVLGSFSHPRWLPETAPQNRRYKTNTFVLHLEPVPRKMAFEGN